jgi:anti-sigma B factor antagonist
MSLSWKLILTHEIIDFGLFIKYIKLAVGIMERTYDITSDFIENTPVLTISGDLTQDADSDVYKTYNELKSKHNMKNMIINFEKIKYINSAGIATLINIIQDMDKTGGKAVLVGLTNHFQKVIDIVGISDFVDIYNTNAEAISEMNK